MGFIEEILAKNSGLIVKFLDLVEGQEVKTKVDLNSVQFAVGKTIIKMSGTIDLTIARKKG